MYVPEAVARSGSGVIYRSGGLRLSARCCCRCLTQRKPFSPLSSMPAQANSSGEF